MGKMIGQKGSQSGEPSKLSNIDEEIINKINEIIKEEMTVFKSELESFKSSIGEENKSLKIDLNKKDIMQLLLNDPNLDVRFYDFVYDDDIEIVKQKICELDEIIKDKVNILVQDRLNGGYKPPKDDDFISFNLKRPSHILAR